MSFIKVRLHVSCVIRPAALEGLVSRRNYLTLQIAVNINCILSVREMTAVTTREL
jgi:hypothetical protein